MALKMFSLTLLLLTGCRPWNAQQAREPSQVKQETHGEWLVGQSDKPCFQPQAHYHSFNPRIISLYFGFNWISIDDQSGKVISSWPENQRGRNGTAAASFNQSLRIASTRADSLVTTNVMTGEEVSLLKFTQPDNRSFFPMELAISSDDRLLVVVGSLDRIESLPDPRALAKNNDIKENQDANRSHGLRMILFDLERNVQLGMVDFQDQYSRKVSFSRDHKFISLISYSGLKFFNIVDPSQISLVTEVPIIQFKGLYNENFPFIFSADVSHDYRLSMISLGTSLVLFDLETRKIIPSFKWSLFPANFMFAIRWLAWSNDDRYIYASDLGSTVYKLIARTGEIVAKSKIDYVSQSWERGVYLDYASNHPKPAFTVSPMGLSFVALASQDPTRPFDCPGLKVHQMKLE